MTITLLITYQLKWGCYHHHHHHHILIHLADLSLVWLQTGQFIQYVAAPLTDHSWGSTLARPNRPDEIDLLMSFLQPTSLLLFFLSSPAMWSSNLLITLYLLPFGSMLLSPTIYAGVASQFDDSKTWMALKFWSRRLQWFFLPCVFPYM